MAEATRLSLSMTSQIQFANHTLATMDFPSLSDKDSTPEPGAINEGFASKKIIPKELTAHGTTPSGKPRLFVCNTCTRAFARLEHLRRHERSHTKEKPFTCGVCQRKFSRRDLLLRHAQKLHAGCTDAITRLRRKLIKSNSISSTSSDLFDDSVLQSPYGDSNDSTPCALPDVSKSSQRSLDAVQFNLNLFNSRRKKEKDPRANPKDANLQRQLFDRRKLSRNRGASFSAQSGGNYAQAMPEYENYLGTGNVEFSTPQLLPSSMSDEHSWLSNLSTIPGMADGFSPAKNGRDDSITSLSLDLEVPTHTSMFPGMLRSDSVTSSTSFNTLDSAAPPYASASMSRNGSLAKVGQPPAKLSEINEYGYSFYDIPESMSGKSFNGPKMNAPLSPIKQELDDELMDLDNNAAFGSQSMIPAAITNGVNFDFNFLNDIDELTQDYDVGSKFLPNGYSFYGDNPLVSSSGIESTTPPQLTSPGNLFSQAPKQQYQGPLLGGGLDKQVLSVDNPSSAFLKRTPENAEGYSKNKLFTRNIRYMINKSLSKYPISGIMTPTIPSNEKLEFYLNYFNDMFLSHYPFIHLSKLNEYEIMSMTANEDMSNESARVCLPLLVATIGALLANNKNDSEHLYEASRRTIHIYLESRKNSVGEANGSSSPAAGQSVNPLWLIQSLTLSVIYGLFSDNENNVYIVIRQLNALNSLVKTSIKSNRTILFSINGEDEEHFRAHNENGMKPAFSLFSDDSEQNNQIMFKNNINMQSQVRIVFMIYKLTNFILMMYNVPLTLNINDLGNLACPNINDEFLWNFKTYHDFKDFLQTSDNHNNLEFYLTKNDSNTIVFKDVLIKLSKSDFDPSLVTRLSNLSKYGFSSVVHGIFEIKQYEEMKYIDVYSILDNLTLFIDNAKNNADTRYPQIFPTDYEKLDYALLVNFNKICSTIDFKLLKEQSWLRNYDELTKNYHKFLISMDTIDDFEYLKVIDCCIVILKLVLFKTDAADAPCDTGRSEIFRPEFNFLASNRSSGDFATMMNESLQHQFNTSANFEKMINWKVFDEVDSLKNSMHSQMLFHVFAILSIFAIHVAKRNNQESDVARQANANNTKQFNQRFILVLRLLAKIESFLKVKYQNSKLENDLTNLYLFSSFNSEELLFDQNNDTQKNDGSVKDLSNLNHNYFNFSLEKSLYSLKIGEMMLRYLYDTNIKVCIFRKLGGSLSQIRKFLIDNDTRVLS